MDAIEAALQKWAKSPEGQKALNGKVIEMYQSGNFTGMGGSGGGRPPQFYADEMIRLLQEEIALHGHEFGEYLYFDDVRSTWDNQLGKYKIVIDFREEKLSRPSLQPEDFDGAYNIVALLNKGYWAPGAVYGEWHGEEIWSKKKRVAEKYIQDAVAKFESLYGAETEVFIDPVYSLENGYGI